MTARVPDLRQLDLPAWIRSPQLFELVSHEWKEVYLGRHDVHAQAQLGAVRSPCPP
jgi:hypothetical protein